MAAEPFTPAWPAGPRSRRPRQADTTRSRREHHAKILTEESSWRRGRTGGTTSDELLRLSDWLAAGGCTHVGLERTGVFTPRTILPTVAGRGLRRRQHADAEDHGDVVVLDLDPLHERLEDLAPLPPVG